MDTCIAAHTPRQEQPEVWHCLDDHLLAVAREASRFARTFGAEELGWWAGLLHDVGKFSPEFQGYLKACFRAKRDGTRAPKPGTAPHSIHGAVVARSAYRRTPSNSADLARGYELAWPILNHHGGLRDRVMVQERLGKGFRDAMVKEVIPGAVGKFEELRRFGSDAPELPTFDSKLGREFFIRMLLSALVDADHSDTEAWMAPDVSAGRRTSFPKIETLSAAVLENQQRLVKGAQAGLVNTVRREIYEAVLDHAVDDPGFFKLTVPTGGGKTRTSLAFALAHASAHDLERVVVAIPYTSITEQTANVYREILGEDNVLEHHSSANVRDDEDDVLNWQKLASENWNAPVVVTTTVQLFESLFANRTSKLRKIHNLARCVIVLDEVQTLPARFLDPILDVLGELTTPRYGSSVVLCTATQPALDERLGFPRLAGVRELAPDPERYFRALKRVDYELHVDRAWPWSEVGAEMMSTHQVLCVVNLKRHARELFEALGDPEALHLSTAMCGVHRHEVLSEVRRRLEVGEPCRVVSTQLIEAGVDVDFPVVFRALGPLDSIVQAAGRCNREGRLERGRVVVFKPEDHALPPGYYKTAAREAESVLTRDVDLNSPEIFEEYFRTLYLHLVERDAEGIQEARKNFDYQTVAERFHLIGDDTEPVIIPWWDEAKDKVDRLRASGLHRNTIRALQPYTVNVFKAHVPRLERLGLIMRASDEVEGIWIWMGKYDERLGVVERLETFVV